MATINIPQIRFKGFEGEWEKKILGEVVTICSMKRVHQSDWTTSGIRFFRARDVVAAFKNEEIEPIFISEEKYREYSSLCGKVSIGDLLVTGVGTIGVPYLIKDSNPIYIKDGNIIWMKNNGSFNGEFLYHCFCGNKVQQFIKETAGTGTVGTYTIANGKKTPIDFTSLPEQNKIASLFTSLDKQISTSEAKLDKLRTIKKTLLKKMFAASGENIPQIRFKGFDGAWEEKKFSDVFNVYSNYSFSRSQLNEINGEIKSIHYGDILIKYGAILDAIKENIPYLNSDMNVHLLSQNYVKDGDIIIADAAEDSMVGKCVEIKNIGKRIVLSGLHTIPCRPKMPFGKGFLGHYMNASAYHSTLIQIMQGSKVSSISKKAISKTYLNYTPNISEQTKIANLLTSVDKQISLQEQKTEKLRAIKKTLLKKMFV